MDFLPETPPNSQSIHEKIRSGGEVAITRSSTSLGFPKFFIVKGSFFFFRSSIFNQGQEGNKDHWQWHVIFKDLKDLIGQQILEN